MFFPKSTVLAPEFSVLPASANGPWLVVWDGTKSAEPSPALVKLMQKLRGITLSATKPAYVEAPCQYTHAKTMKLGYVLVPGTK